MELVYIFVDGNNEGIHSVKINGYSENEYERMFDCWFDTEYLLGYCQKYQREIFGNFGISNLEEFVDSVYEEALMMEDVFLDFNNNYLGLNNSRLNDIFRPLDNSNYRSTSLQVSKAKVPSNIQPNKYPIFRVYSIKISDSTFIITGGCLKFTFQLAETNDCKSAESKTNRIRDWLKEINCETQDDIDYYYESGAENN